MFESPEQTLSALNNVGYFTDHKTATTVYLAGRINKPVMLEGPAGAGKTELAQSVARAASAGLVRLQCYQGINEEKAIGHFDKSLQELFVLLKTKSEGTCDWAQIRQEITSRAFFLAGPLLTAIERERRCVLLIDEIDKVDYAFEAQAFKRACCCFGLGRYFYDFAEMWVDLDDYGNPLRISDSSQVGASSRCGPDEGRAGACRLRGAVAAEHSEDNGERQASRLWIGGGSDATNRELSSSSGRRSLLRGISSWWTFAMRVSCPV